jgi:hypothetical protein
VWTRSAGRHATVAPVLAVVAHVLAPVAAVLAAIAHVFAPVADVLATIPHVFQVVAEAAVVASIAHILAAIADVLAAIPHILATVADVLASVASVLAAVPHVFGAVAPRMTLGGGLREGGDRDGNQHHRGERERSSAQHMASGPFGSCARTVRASLLVRRGHVCGVKRTRWLTRPV